MRSGSCNPPSLTLQSRCRDYRHYLATDNIARKKELLREQIAKNREYYAKLERQRSLLLQDLDYGRRTLERDSLLLAEAVISAADYETTAQNYLSKQNAQAGFDATLTSTELQIIQSEQQLVELTLQQENETAEYERTLEQSRQQLAARIAQWRQQYVLEAPVTGRGTLVELLEREPARRRRRQTGEHRSGRVRRKLSAACRFPRRVSAK